MACGRSTLFFSGPDRQLTFLLWEHEVIVFARQDFARKGALVRRSASRIRIQGSPFAGRILPERDRNCLKTEGIKFKKS